MNIEESINEISQNVGELSSKKNINEVMKLHNDINKKIKNTSKEIQKLKVKFEENTEENTLDINDTNYEKIVTKLINNDIDKMINSDKLEYQIDEYKKIYNKIKQCINFLESKKITIIECDK